MKNAWATVKVFILPVISGLILLSSGCETVKGVGRDVTSVGEVSERAISGSERPATQPVK